MRRAFLAIVLAALLSACLFGKGSKSAESSASGEAAIEYVPIAIAWVKRHVNATPSEVAAWSKSTEAKAAMPQTEIRHLLSYTEPGATPKQIAAAKKRAVVLAARVAKGEKIKDLAAEESDDEETRERGGALGKDASRLEEPLRSVAKNLAPGAAASEIVRSPDGFHVVARDGIDARELLDAYKKARAVELARKLADDILSRMQSSSDSLDEITKGAIVTWLGPKAIDDPKRRSAVTIARDKAAEADLPPDAKEALVSFARKAKPGDAVDSPLGTGPVIVIARAVASK